MKLFDNKHSHVHSTYCYTKFHSTGGIQYKQVLEILHQQNLIRIPKTGLTMPKYM